MSKAADELRRLIKTKTEIAEQGDYFRLLGVKRSADAAEVKRAYFALAKELHPDRIGQFGLTDVKTEAARLFKAVTEAHGTLSDPGRRDAYLKAQAEGTAPTGTGTSATARQLMQNKVEAAKIAFHKGSVMLSKRSYPEAERFFREATQEDDGVARYWQSLGWAVFHNEGARAEKARLEEARKCYEKALEIDDEDAITHYNVGLYWKARGKVSRSRRAMEKALEFKPDFVEAKREIRLANMRQEKAKRLRQTTNSSIIEKIRGAFKKK